MNSKDKLSARKRIKSFIYALNGIKVAICSQHNLWIHIIATIVVVLFGILLSLNILEWCLVIFAIGFVIASEIFNTAIEFLVDHISPEYNKKAGLIKDIAAGGVLISAFTAAIIGFVIFIPKIIYYLCN